MKTPTRYARYVLPVLIDLAMRNKAARAERARFVPLARGVTLEIGVGSGLNIPYYSSEIETLYALDPSEELLRKAVRLGKRSTFPIVPLCHAAERIPLPDASIDSVVMTWTLCSIADPLAALAEIRRVLTIWRRFAGGCHLNRPIEALLAHGGFAAPGIEKSYVPGPRFGSYFYRGIARSVINLPQSVAAAPANGGRNGT
jgi:ubiquinone/menaquinone biosynthesis C-methylase UbiE